MKRIACFALIFVAAVPLTAGRKPTTDPKLVDLTSIFVTGNNQAAEKARDVIQSGKTCFTLATKADAADGVLAIDAQSQSQGGQLGSFGARNWIASGTLTLKSGDLVWSQSERFDDAPFRSGGKVAGDLLVRRLALEAGCKERTKK